MNEALKRLVWDRAQSTCEYCRLPQSLDVLPFQIDHVTAEQHHGPTVAENLALCCLNDNPVCPPFFPAHYLGAEDSLYVEFGRNSGQNSLISAP